MQTSSSPTLLKRIGAVLHAKQYLVFYAIGLFTLNYAATLGGAWLAQTRPLDTLLGENLALFDLLASSRNLGLFALTAAFLSLSTWFRAGFLRSLVGRLHWGPCDGAQFRRLLGFAILIGLLAWAKVAGFAAVHERPGYTDLVLLVSTAISLVIMYADYAIVVSGVSLLQALRQSWRTVRANLLVSLLVALSPLVLATFVVGLLSTPSGNAARLMPVLVIEVLVWGSVSFVCDVVLLTVYIDSLERGRIPDGHD